MHASSRLRRPRRLAMFAALASVASGASGAWGQSLYEDYQYDAYGNVLVHRGPVYGPVPDPTELAQQTHTYTYQYASGYSLLQTANHPGGQVETWTWDSQFRVVTHDRQGGAHVESLTYDTAGRLASETLSNASESYTWSYVYLAGNRTQITDFRGAVTLETRDSSGRLIQRVGPAADATAIQALINAGQVESFNYDAAGDLVSQSDAAGGVSTFVYNAAHDLLSATDPNLLTTRYEYDAQHHVTKITRPGVSTALGSELFSYDASGRLAASGLRIDATTVCWIGCRYDAAGNLASQHGPATSLATALALAASQSSPLSSADHDALGRETTTYDAAGNPIETRGYDARNRETSHTYFATGSAGASHDAAGRPTSWYDSDGNTTAYAWDSLGRQLSETGPWLDADGDGVADDADPAPSRARTWNLGDLPLTETETGSPSVARQYRWTDLLSEQVGNVKTTYVLDSAGRVAAEVRGATTVASYVRDPVGRVLTERLLPGTANEVRCDYGYDAGGRVRTLTEYPVALMKSPAIVTTYDYDAYGELCRVVDGAGNGWSYVRDLTGRLLQIVPDSGPITTYAYDLLGRLTAKSVQGETGWTYAYTGERMTGATHGTETWSFAYDVHGNLTSQTEADGTVYAFAYDAHGRMVQATSSAAPGTPRTYGYDAHGRLAWVQEGIVADGFARDAAGRVTVFANAFGEVFTYAYDSAGRRTSVTYPNGDVFAYAYGNDDLLSSIDLVRGSVVERVVDVQHDALGRVVHRTLRNRVDESYAYDGCGRLRDYLATATGGGATLAHRTYARNGDGRIASIQHGASDVETFAYSATGALDFAQRTGPYAYVLDPQYDASGRMTAIVKNGVTTNFDYDAMGRLTRARTGAAQTTYGYDAAGRIVQRVAPATTRTWQYGPWGRASAITSGGTTTQLYRDPFGSILGAVTGSTIDYFTLDEAGETALAWSNWVLAEESFGLVADQNLWSERPAGDTTFVNDPVGGSVLRLLDESSGAVASNEYLPFGELLAQSGGTWNLARFQGMHWDAASGLYWNDARTYDPEDRRFVEPDPLRGGGLALDYARVGNDPINAIDPTGLCTIGTVTGKIEHGARAPETRPTGISVGSTKLASVTIDGEKYKYWNPIKDVPCYPKDTDHEVTIHSGNASYVISVVVASPGDALPGGPLTVGPNLPASTRFHEDAHAELIQAYIQRFLEHAINTLGGIRSIETHDPQLAHKDCNAKWIKQRDAIVKAASDNTKSGSPAFGIYDGGLHGILVQPRARVGDTYDATGPAHFSGPTGTDPAGQPIPNTSFQHPSFAALRTKIVEQGDKDAAAGNMTTSPCECKHHR